jgi:hypothetical protein
MQQLLNSGESSFRPGSRAGHFCGEGANDKEHHGD